LKIQSLLNRYPQTPEQAVETAHQVLSEIQNLKVPANPIHYILIYEWLTKIDDYFYEEVDQTIKLKAYNNDSANALFSEFIAHLSSQQLPTDHFGQLLTELKLKLEEWIHQTGQCNETLQAQLSQLKESESAKTVTHLLEEVILPQILSVQTQNEVLHTFIEKTTSKVTQLQHEIENITRISLTDELTGIPNRRGFNQAIHKIIEQAKTTQTSFVLCMVDIDFFKKINDHYGHLVGDSILRFLAKFLQKQTKGMDLIARIGGEEFILVLPETLYSSGLKVAQGMCQKLAKHPLQIAKRNQPISLNISIGVAAYQMGESLEDLIDRADKSLYLAKNTGRNKVCGEADL